VAGAKAYLHAKYHLDPSNHLATIHRRHRQTDKQDRTDRQWSDGIGRTILQTVAQLTMNVHVRCVNEVRFYDVVFSAEWKVFSQCTNFEEGKLSIQ